MSLRPRRERSRSPEPRDRWQERRLREDRRWTDWTEGPAPEAARVELFDPEDPEKVAAARATPDVPWSGRPGAMAVECGAGECDFSAEPLRRGNHQPGTLFVVALARGRVVALASFRNGGLISMVVHPGWRRRGLCVELAARVAAEMRERGVREAAVDAAVPAVPCYLRGFRGFFPTARAGPRARPWAVEPGDIVAEARRRGEPLVELRFS